MKKSSDAKIAIITVAEPVREEEYLMGKHLIAKYGADKVVHAILPTNFIAEKEQFINMTAALAADNEIKILVIPHAVPGTNLAIDKFRKTRDDVFIILGRIQEPASECAERANLIIQSNNYDMGPPIVKQAKKQGAKVFVHYSFPRHMSIPVVSGRFDLIRQNCQDEGLQFVDASVPDPTGEAGIDSAQRFIINDVQEMVRKYGNDTAFFCTNCHLQEPLIKAVVENHAIYPQPCCPSPFHGFPKALGIETTDFDLHHLISEASRIAEEKGMSDRLSSWPVSDTMLIANAGIEYAKKWLDAEVPKTGIDNAVLMECMDEYITEAVGEESHIYMNSYKEGGISYDNFKNILMSYLDF